MNFYTLVKSVILFVALLIVPVIWGGCSDVTPDETWKRSVAEVIMTRGGKGSSTEIAFYDEQGVRHECFATQLSVYGMEIGDKFTMVYNPKNVKEFVVYDHEPVFVEKDTNSIGRTTGTVKRLYRSVVSLRKDRESTFAVEFSFEVEGTRYRRAQVLPSGFKTKYPGIAQGSDYEVRYKKAHPAIAVMMFDRR